MAEDVRTLVEDRGRGRDVGGGEPVALAHFQPEAGGHDVIDEPLDEGAIRPDQIVVDGEDAADVARPRVPRHVKDAAVPGHLGHRAEGLTGGVGGDLVGVERGRHVGLRHLHQLDVPLSLSIMRTKR